MAEVQASMKHQVRRCTVMDLGDMLRIAVTCYPPFDHRKALAWAEGAMLNPKFGFFRTDNAWGCAVLAEVFYEDKTRCAMMFLAGRDGKAWEAIAVLKALIEWGRRAGAASFTFGEDTGMRMETLAKRLGAQRERPAFRLDLKAAPQKPETSYISSFWKAA